MLFAQSNIESRLVNAVSLVPDSDQLRTCQRRGPRSLRGGPPDENNQTLEVERHIFRNIDSAPADFRGRRDLGPGRRQGRGRRWRGGDLQSLPVRFPRGVVVGLPLLVVKMDSK